MKSTDKFLIGIVTGILLLVAVALAIALTRPEATYLPEDSPENVTHNYLLALNQENYERAYAYLSPTVKNYPSTIEQFVSDVETDDWFFRKNQNVSLEVESARLTGDLAVVAVNESRFAGNGLFNANQIFNRFEMQLMRENNQWKIVRGDYYFSRQWDDSR